MMRKVIKWELYAPPPQYTPTIECGHDPGGGADGEGNFSAEEKQTIETYNNNQVKCFSCADLEKQALALEKQAKDIRAKMKAGK